MHLLNYHFHMSIFDASGNGYLVEFVDDLLEKTMRLFTCSLRPTRF